MLFQIQFDVMYLDGNLKGHLIPGEVVQYTDRSAADRALAFYVKVEREKDFIRAAVTGHRYQVSNVTMHTVPK